MKLKLERTPYSSVVGGGLLLVDEAGRPRFQLALIGTTNGITKEETAAIADAFAAAMPEGIDVPDRL